MRNLTEFELRYQNKADERKGKDAEKRGKMQRSRAKGKCRVHFSRGGIRESE